VNEVLRELKMKKMMELKRPTSDDNSVGRWAI
jgi:hypothetical protein